MTLTAEQIELRRHGLGSSDIPAIMGLDKHRSAFQVWIEKTQPPKEPKAQSQEQERGHWLEVPVAERYLREHPALLRRTVFTIAHPANSWMLATPDMLVDESPSERACSPLARLVEIKTTRKRLDPETCEQLYECQARWQLAVAHPLMGVSRCDVAAWSLLEEAPFYYPIERDETIEKGLIEIAKDFWFGNVVAKKEPEPDQSDEYARYCNLKPSEGKTLTVDKDHALTLLVELYRNAQVNEKLWDAEVKAQANRLRYALLELDCVEGPFGKIYYRSHNGKGERYKDRESIDWETIARFLATEIELRGKGILPDGAVQEIFARLVHENTTITPAGRMLKPVWKENGLGKAGEDQGQAPGAQR